MPHTPGPWKVERRWSNECEIVPRITCAPDADRQCGWIADVIGAPYLGHESTLPNARLIAAAPDLLAALESLLEANVYADGEGMCYINETDTEEGMAAVKLARAAIARATGETS